MTEVKFWIRFWMVVTLGILMPLSIVAAKVRQAVPESQGTILWQGFHHKWQNNPHRLSKFGSYFKEISYDEGTDSLLATHRSVFRVGAYDDTGTVKSTGTFVKSGVLGIYHGYVDESCLKVSEEVGDSDSAECREQLDLAALGLSDYDDVTVILRGFQVWPTTYSSGYNTRGFSVRVIPGARTGATYNFTAALSVHPEHSPDRPQLDDKCWEDSHCKKYTYKGRIYYTVIAVKSANGVIIEADPAGTNSYDAYVKMSPYKVPAEASESKRSASIQGAEGFEHGLVAIQGLSWHLGNWSSTAKDGRYIRDIEMNLSHIDYDPNTGQADFLTNMYFSNSGAWPYGFDAKFTMWNTLIQFNDRDFDAAQKAWFTGTVREGGSDFEEKIGYGF